MAGKTILIVDGPPGDRVTGTLRQSIPVRHDREIDSLDFLRSQFLAQSGTFCREHSPGREKPGDKETHNLTHRHW